MTPLPSAPSPEEARDSEHMAQYIRHHGEFYTPKLTAAHVADIRDHFSGERPASSANPLPNAWIRALCDQWTELSRENESLRDSRVVSPSAGARMSEELATVLLVELERTVCAYARAADAREDAEGEPGAQETLARSDWFRARAALKRAIVGPSQPSTDTESR